MGDWGATITAQQHSRSLAADAVLNRGHAAALVLARAATGADLDAVVSKPGTMVILSSATALVLALLGGWSLAGRTRVDPSVAAWTAVYVCQVVATILWLPFNWPRYYQPVVVLAPPLIAAGAAMLVDTLARARAS